MEGIFFTWLSSLFCYKSQLRMNSGSPQIWKDERQFNETNFLPDFCIYASNRKELTKNNGMTPLLCLCPSWLKSPDIVKKYFSIKKRLLRNPKRNSQTKSQIQALSFWQQCKTLPFSILEAFQKLFWNRPSKWTLLLQIFLLHYSSWEQGTNIQCGCFSSVAQQSLFALVL